MVQNLGQPKQVRSDIYRSFLLYCSLLTLWVSQTAFCAAGAPFCKSELRPLSNSSFWLFCRVFLAAFLLAVSARCFCLLFAFAFDCLCCSFLHFLCLLFWRARLLPCWLSFLPAALFWKKLQKWGSKKKKNKEMASPKKMVWK